MILLEAHPAATTSLARRDAARLWLMLLGAAIVLLLRCPPVWLHPRLWAEEGTVYLPAALEHGFWGNLFAVQLGYYSLLDNLVIGFASLFPLQYVAHFTVYAAALIALVPIAVVLTLPSQWWPDLRWRGFVVVALLLLPSEESYLNLINSQFYFTTACALLLVVDFARTSRRERYAIAILLVVSALSSPQSCFLLPAFWLRAWLGREPVLQKLSLVFSLAALAQFAGVVAASQQAVQHVPRGLPADYSVRDFFKALAADIWLNPFYRGLRDPWQARAAQYIVGYLLLLCSFIAMWRVRHAIWLRVLGAALLVVALLSLLTSVGMEGGQRYAYASSSLLLLILLGALRQPGSVLRPLVGGLLLLALFSQISMYPMRAGRNFDASWPSWQEALQAWRSSGAAQAEGVVIWPVSTGWRVPAEALRGR